MKLILKINLIALALLVVSCATQPSTPLGVKTENVPPKWQIFTVVRNSVTYHIGIIKSDEFTDGNQTIGNIYKEALHRGWTLLPLVAGDLVWKKEEFSDQDLQKMGISRLAVISPSHKADQDFIFSIHIPSAPSSLLDPDGTRHYIADPSGSADTNDKFERGWGFAFLVPFKLI